MARRSRRTQSRLGYFLGAFSPFSSADVPLGTAGGGNRAHAPAHSNLKEDQRAGILNNLSNSLSEAGDHGRRSRGDPRGCGNPPPPCHGKPGPLQVKLGQQSQQPVQPSERRRDRPALCMAIQEAAEIRARLARQTRPALNRTWREPQQPVQPPDRRRGPCRRPRRPPGSRRDHRCSATPPLSR